jgi:hypothetical protein
MNQSSPATRYHLEPKRFSAACRRSEKISPLISVPGPESGEKNLLDLSGCTLQARIPQPDGSVRTPLVRQDF